MSQQTAR